MLHAVEENHRIEIIAMSGAVAHLGAKLSVPTPLIAAMAALIRAIEEGYPVQLVL